MSTASNLAEMDHDKLVKVAVGLGIATKGLSDQILIDKIEKETIKKTLRFEKEAKDELRKEQEAKLGFSGKKKRRPSPQDIAIRHSRKVIVLFRNMEHPAADGEDGADVMFTMGSYNFHLYDNHRFVMPECITTDEPLNDVELQDTLTDFWEGAGLPAKRARAQAISDLLQICLNRRCSYPVNEERPDPRNPGRFISVPIRNEPRFLFEYKGPAPKDAEVGDLADPENRSDSLKSNDELIKQALATPKGARPPKQEPVTA